MQSYEAQSAEFIKILHPTPRYKPRGSAPRSASPAATRWAGATRRAYMVNQIRSVGGGQGDARHHPVAELHRCHRRPVCDGSMNARAPVQLSDGLGVNGGEADYNVCLLCLAEGRMRRGVRIERGKVWLGASFKSAQLVDRVLSIHDLGRDAAHDSSRPAHQSALNLFGPAITQQRGLGHRQLSQGSPSPQRKIERDRNQCNVTRRGFKCGSPTHLRGFKCGSPTHRQGGRGPQKVLARLRSTPLNAGLSTN
jgi:hypothetical protein